MHITNIVKHNRIIIIILIISVSVYFLTRNLIEGLGGHLGQTSCTQFYSCSDCVNGSVTSSSSPCYWNNTKKVCGSFNDTGYSRTCPESSDLEAN